MYWHRRLVIPALQRFCTSQQVARLLRFPLILLQAKAGGVRTKNFGRVRRWKKFPLILLQAKAGGPKVRGTKDFYMVSINSPSGEGGGI